MLCRNDQYCELLAKLADGLLTGVGIEPALLTPVRSPASAPNPRYW